MYLFHAPEKAISEPDADEADGSLFDADLYELEQDRLRAMDEQDD